MHVPTASFMFDDSVSVEASDSCSRPPSVGSARGHYQQNVDISDLQAVAAHDGLPAAEEELDDMRETVKPGGAPRSFVDHPTAKSPVMQPPQQVKGRLHRFVKLRPIPKPRAMPDFTPLYYIEGTTGYECLQYRTSSGLYGSRVFSVKSSDPAKAQAKGEWNDTLVQNYRANRETTSSSLGSYSSNVDHHYLKEACHVKITFEDHQVWVPEKCCRTVCVIFAAHCSK